jgi:hypothetical protein
MVDFYVNEGKDLVVFAHIFPEKNQEDISMVAEQDKLVSDFFYKENLILSLKKTNIVIKQNNKKIAEFDNILTPENFRIRFEPDYEEPSSEPPQSFWSVKLILNNYDFLKKNNAQYQIEIVSIDNTVFLSQEGNIIFNKDQ